MRWSPAPLLVIVAACGFHKNGVAGDDTGPGDAGSGGGSDSGSDLDAAVDPDAAPFPDGDMAHVPCLDRWKTGTIRFDPPVKVPSFSTSAVERDPFLAPAPKNVLYASRPQTSGSNEDIYEALPDGSGGYGAATRVGALSTSDPDEKLAVGGNVVVIARGAAGQVDLVEAQMTLDANGEITPSGGFDSFNFANTNSALDDHDPWLSGDGKKLVWAPAVTGGGLQILERSTRSGTNAQFAAPTPLGLSEDATTNLGDPWLTDDEMLVVYTATVAGGNSQIRYAIAATPTTWMPSADVPDINDATHADGDPIVTAKGCTILFGSDRAGTWDIYTATVHDPPPP